MQKNIPVDAELHQELKLESVHKGVSLKQHITDLHSSQQRLSQMLRDLMAMKKGDVYRIDIGGKMIALQADEVFEVEN